MVHSVKCVSANIPAIGLGTWELRDEQCALLVSEALKAGYRHIDTAAMYQNEEAVGAGILAGGVPRDEIFVTTKVWYEDLGPGKLEASAETSLRKLGLEEVDLLLVHWPRPDLTVTDMIDPLVEALERGLTRHIGVSNFPSALLREAFERSEGRLVTNQCEYHPYLDQDKLLDTCRELGISFTSYCPIGRAESLSEDVVRSLAAKYQKSPAQIVLRWQVQQPNVIAIPRTSKVERLSENLDVGDFELTADEMISISALRAKNHRICDYAFSPKWDD